MPDSLPAVVETLAIPDLGTDEAVAITVAHMQRLAARDAQHLRVIAATHDVLAAAQPYSTAEVAKAIYKFVQSRLTFRPDEVHVFERFGIAGDNVEFLQSPAYLLSLDRPQGDCDCYSMLLAAMLHCAGVPCCYATIAANAELPQMFSHIYVVAYPANQRMPLDASHGPYAGWEYPEYTRIREW